MKLTLTKDRHDTLRLSMCSYNQSDTGLKIDIKPAADGEHPHLYVTIKKEDGEVYEGRLLLNGSGHVALTMPQPVADLVTETLGMDAKSAAFDPELRKNLKTPWLRSNSPDPCARRGERRPMAYFRL